MSIIRNAVHSVALEVIGPVTKQHHDWFERMTMTSKPYWKKNTTCSGPTTTPPVQQRKLPSLTCTAKFSASYTPCRTLGSVPRLMKSKAMLTKMTQRFYDALKGGYGLQSSGSPPLLRADGSSLLKIKSRFSRDRTLQQ